MSEPKDAGGITVGDRIETKCCSCGADVIFKLLDDADPNDMPTFFHKMPYCKRFDDTNTADQLIQYMRDCVNATKN